MTELVMAVVVIREFSGRRVQQKFVLLVSKYYACLIEWNT